MPTWGEILKEIIEERKKNGNKCLDIIRRKYLKILYELTGRNTIVYAGHWTDPPASPNSSINIGDIQGLMETVKDLKGDELDFILHSPGGSAEAAEAILLYLRKKFSDIRIIIPFAAMSAATMLSCGSNKIVMGKHSYIGPIDPQMILITPLGTQMIPTQAILDQFYLAKSECQIPQTSIPWMPILPQYGPALIMQCKNAQDLSKDLVENWLGKYMFSKNIDGKEKATKIAEFLGNHTNFKSHSRYIEREMARKAGLIIEDLENDPDFQDAVLSVFHSYMHTFSISNGVNKIIENHLGKALVRKSQEIQIPLLPAQRNPNQDIIKKTSNKKKNKRVRLSKTVRNRK